MQVVSLAPVPVTSLCWRIGDGPWVMTVICKLTFELEPGEALLAKRHDPIHEADRFPADDTSLSLYAPSDLVPLRPLVDVSLVGSAYSPRGAPATSLSTRLRVLTIDKSLHINATTSADGPHSFRSAPLNYEFAPATATNPIGIAGEPPVSQPYCIGGMGDVDATNPSFTSPGYGPIAGHWPSRSNLLAGNHPPDPLLSNMRCVLPPQFPMKFYQAAPPDQQLPELAPNCKLLLDNLHPDHASLHTRLPNVAPQVFIERADDSQPQREEAAATIRSLWIDTRRSLATVTWHSQIALSQVDEPGRVWLAVAGPSRRLTQTQLTKLIGTLRSSKVRGAGPRAAEDKKSEKDDGERHNRTVAMRSTRSQLPPDNATSRRSNQSMPGARGEITSEGKKPSSDGLPVWAKNQRASSPPPPARASAARATTVDHPSLDPRFNERQSTPPAPPDYSHRRASQIPAAPAKGPGAVAMPPPPGAGSAAEAANLPRQPSIPPPAPSRQPPPAAPTAVPAAGASYASLADAPPLAKPSQHEAQHLAADGQAIAPVGRQPIAYPAATPLPPQAKPSWPGAAGMHSPPLQLEDTGTLPKPALGTFGSKLASPPAEVVEMLWFDPDATNQLRRGWRTLCEELEFAPLDPRHDSASDDPAKARRHHIHAGVLSGATPIAYEGLRTALQESISETGRFTPPLVLLSGEIAFPFDEAEVLRATVAVVRPVSRDDKRIKEAIKQAEELLATPLVTGSSETVRSFTNHLRNCYIDGRRTLSVNYLQETVERILLEGRCYQRRTLFGGTWLRAQITVKDNRNTVVAYLPEDLEKKLPMMASFNARIIAEAHVKQDQYEMHPYALRVVTLGRVIKVED